MFPMLLNTQAAESVNALEEAKPKIANADHAFARVMNPVFVPSTQSTPLGSVLNLHIFLAALFARGNFLPSQPALVRLLAETPSKVSTP